MNAERFLEKGFDVVQADNPDKITGLREGIFEKAKDLVDYKNEGLEEFFDKFHTYGLRGAELNERRLALTSHCTDNLRVGAAIFEAFSGHLTDLLGPDTLVQKAANLVIQQPGDPDSVPTHRDAPLNSPFEVVVWMPLVDVYGTKSMYMLDRQKSEVALELLGKPGSGYDEYSRYAAQEGKVLNVPFGHACFFWAGLVHGVALNKEDETRWALNHRYRSVFAPAGSKGLSEFFDILHLSPLSRIAFDYERKAHG